MRGVGRKSPQPHFQFALLFVLWLTMYTNIHTVYWITCSYRTIVSFFSCYSYITIQLCIQNLERNPRKGALFFQTNLTSLNQHFKWTFYLSWSGQATFIKIYCIETQLENCIENILLFKLRHSFTSYGLAVKNVTILITFMFLTVFPIKI